MIMNYDMYLDNVPCAWLPIVGQIHVVFVVVQDERDLIPSEGPAAKLHYASLLIKGEVSDVNGARTLQNKRMQH